MAYNRCAYKGIRVIQFTLAVVTVVTVMLIGDKNGFPLLIGGVFRPFSQLSFAQQIPRGIATLGPFLLYPFLSVVTSCCILCCRKACRPNAVTLWFDALGIIIFLFSGVVFVICIKENESSITSLVNQLADKYLPGGLSKTINSVVNNVRTIANEGIDYEKTNHVLEGCLVYFAIQVFCCAFCIYLAVAYKKNSNREQSRMV